MIDYTKKNTIDYAFRIAAITERIKGKTGADVAKEFKVSEKTVRNWIKYYRIGNEDKLRSVKQFRLKTKMDKSELLKMPGDASVIASLIDLEEFGLAKAAALHGITVQGLMKRRRAYILRGVILNPKKQNKK